MSFLVRFDFVASTVAVFIPTPAIPTRPRDVFLGIRKLFHNASLNLFISSTISKNVLSQLIPKREFAPWRYSTPIGGRIYHNLSAPDPTSYTTSMTTNLMPSPAVETFDTAILTRAISPSRKSLSRDVAEEILQWD